MSSYEVSYESRCVRTYSQFFFVRSFHGGLESVICHVWIYWSRLPITNQEQRKFIRLFDNGKHFVELIHKLTWLRKCNWFKKKSFTEEHGGRLLLFSMEQLFAAIATSAYSCPIYVRRFVRKVPIWMKSPTLPENAPYFPVLGLRIDNSPTKVTNRTVDYI